MTATEIKMTVKKAIKAAKPVKTAKPKKAKKPKVISNSNSSATRCLTHAEHCAVYIWTSIPNTQPWDDYRKRTFAEWDEKHGVEFTAHVKSLQATAQKLRAGKS